MIVAAFCLGWLVYMIAMVLTVYDGLPSLILQPFMAALVSGIFVSLAVLFGLLLRIPPLWRWWRQTPLWAGLVAAASLFVLSFGYFIGLTYVGTNPETGTEVVTLHPAAVIGGYFGSIFAVTNWPTRGKRRARPPLDGPAESIGSAGPTTPVRSGDE